MNPLAARVAASLSLALVLAQPLEAQPLDSVAAGSRIRVSRDTPPRVVVGTLIRSDSVSLVILRGRGLSSMTMPLSGLRRVDISRGARPKGDAFTRGAGRGALVGLGVGLVATGLAIKADRECNDCMIPGTLIVAPLSVAFTGVTALVGGVIGVATRERWSRVWPPR